MQYCLKTWIASLALAKTARVASLMLAMITSVSLFASPQTDYLARFDTYLQFQKNLPTKPTLPFVRFIMRDAPLSNTLRNRWLMYLGQKQDWKNFRQYYRKNNDTALNCYAALAEYYLGQKSIALNEARSIWLSAQNQPAACSALFNLLIHSPDFDTRYIDARVILALNQENAVLIPYLLGLYPPPKQETLKLFQAIQKNPTAIQALPRDLFHGYFYVYGLKRLVAQKNQAAWPLWRLAQSEHRLSEAQMQQFITYVAIYKAFRGENDAQDWFNQVKPAYYTDPLLEWQIRLALKRLDWPTVERLTRYYHDKTDPAWQYWLARALEAQGKANTAYPLYDQLAQNRTYYGFLASKRLHRPLAVEAEEGSVNLKTLQAYAPITTQVAYLKNHRPGEAAKLLREFTSELPEEDQITLVHWVGNVLQWYPQSIALTNQLDLKNHLVLRFPLAYHNLVSQMAQKYQLPEALIYAVIRQESAFRDDVVSSAGAKGLMQLMPATAKMVAHAEAVPYHNHKQLFHIPTNLTLGSAYLHHLFKRFDGNPVLMAAAYNAGPGQVANWLKILPNEEMDIWVETIPWRETRNYLKNVMAFYAIYEYRLSSTVIARPRSK